MKQTDDIIPVLIIVPSLECGGLERNISILCNHIDTRAFRVTLAVIDHSRPFYTISNPSIRVVDLQCKRVRQSIWKIRKLVQTERPRLLLCAANHLNLFMAICRPLFPRNIPIIARESSVVSVNTERTPFPALYHWLLKTFYRKLDCIVCQSEYMKEDLVRKYRVPENKTRILYNALQVPEAPPVSEKNIIPQFISVGRLSEEKGIDRILQAIALLKTPFHYTVIGDGPERQKLETMALQLGIGKQVHFTGSSHTPFALVPSPDLFLMASHYEGFPNALMEAHALGIPVVAFRAPGGIPELIRPGLNGLLVEGQEPKDLAMAIEVAMGTPFNREEIRTHTRNRYDPQTNARAWQKLFEELSSKRPA